MANGNRAMVHIDFLPSLSSSLYSVHVPHQLPIPFITGLQGSISTPPIQFSPPHLLYSPITHLPPCPLSRSVGKSLLPVVCIPATYSSTGVFNADHNCWENYSLCLVRLPLLVSPSPRLSCSHVVRFLSPSVVFLFSDCVCTECHEFDIVIA